MNPALRTAFALALAAAVSLGLARFSYALLLPPMRADLAWSYTTAGAMNTVNAAGYLLGALLAPRWLQHHDARRVMLVGGALAALLLALHAIVRSDFALYLLRAATGVVSAASFVGGGLLAARLAGSGGLAPGTVLGLYYGGTGAGIVVSALLVPLLAPSAVGWPAAWVALGAVAALTTALTAAGTRTLVAPAVVAAAHCARFAWAPMAFGLLGYLCFGLGYIGYMTFIVTLLREQLLAVATLLPVLSSHVAAVFASGLLFGAVFLQVVASTTALVRHNHDAAAWPAGITAFTIIFALGQIVGPTLVGWIADGAGGLLRGLAWSAAALALGALLASLQRPLARQRWP